MPDRELVSGTRQAEDLQFEVGLRPRRLADFIGQAKLKENLGIAIKAARLRGEAMDHVLLYGPPGLGKTTLASIIGQELEVRFSATAGPVLQKKKDLSAVLSNIHEHEVFFIDEIHRLLPDIEEMLYSALEDFRMDLIIGSGPGARAPARALRSGAAPGSVQRGRAANDCEPVGRPPGGGDRAGRGGRDCAPLPGHAAYRQPAAAARPRLRPGTRRRPHHAARGPHRAQPARRGPLRPG